MIEAIKRGATLGTLRRRLKVLGTRHPAWRHGFMVRQGPLQFPSGWRVTAIDASGAEFGFGVEAGWPEMAEQMANELAVLLNELQGIEAKATPA